MRRRVYAGVRLEIQKWWRSRDEMIELTEQERRGRRHQDARACGPGWGRDVERGRWGVSMSGFRGRVEQVVRWPSESV